MRVQAVCLRGHGALQGALDTAEARRTDRRFRLADRDRRGVRSGPVQRALGGVRGPEVSLGREPPSEGLGPGVGMDQGTRESTQTSRWALPPVGTHQTPLDEGLAI